MASDITMKAFFERQCSEGLPKTPLFGIGLDKYMEVQKKTLPFFNEPWIVRKCCDYLREYGLKTEGVFRVPGSTSAVKKISDQFDVGSNPDFSSAFVEDVAGVLKKYLRDLPDHLLSDGTPEDPVMKGFLQTVELEETEETTVLVTRLTELVKQIPRYRRAVLVDIFHLFWLVVAYSNVNLMTSDNVATIFGGMTTIMASNMTGSQRSLVVRLLIDNFTTIFDGQFEITPPPEDTGKETKEGIRVYLHDGTFKSLFCQSTENAKEVAKKAIAKIQQSTDIDVSNLQLAEFRDFMWRKLGEAEKVVPCIKAGSSLLMTDKLKGASNQKPQTPIQLEIPKKSKSKAKSPRSSADKSSDLSTSLSPLSHSAANFVQTPSSGSLSRPSPRDAASPLPFGIPTVMPVWIFPVIPLKSSRATEWDPNSTIEGNVEIRCTPHGSSVTVISGDRTWNFVPNGAASVEDSTRYFIMSGPHQRLGLGYETRDEALRYKTLLQQLLQFDQLHAVSVPTGPIPPSASIFADGPLDSHVIMENGFYETGLISGALASLLELTNSAVDLKSPEILLVDSNQDLRLSRLLTVAKKVIPSAGTIEDRARALALYVSGVFGGIDISEGLGSPDDFDPASLDSISKESIASLRTKTHSNIIKIGNITHGIGRHRAILFKYLADHLLPAIPTVLVRTTPLPQRYPIYAVCLATGIASKLHVIDLVNDPGAIFPPESSVSKSISSKVHGTVNSESCSRQHAQHGEELESATFAVAPPSLSQSSSLRIFELAFKTPWSINHRAVLGNVPVFVTDILVPEGTGSDRVAKASALTSNIHPNIAATFGYGSIQHPPTFRIIGEYFGLGNLRHQIEIQSSRQVNWAKSTVWCILNEIAEGLSHLHSQGMAHGNLTSHSVLVDGDGVEETFARVKLAQPIFLSTEKVESCVRWLAPEALKGGDFDPKAADIWSLGMIIYEMATLNLPYFESSSAQISSFINTGTLPTLADDSPFYSLFLQCCQVDPTSRISIDELLNVAREAFLIPATPRI